MFRAGERTAHQHNAREYEGLLGASFLGLTDYISRELGRAVTWCSQCVAVVTERQCELCYGLTTECGCNLVFSRHFGGNAQACDCS
jgi:hypothetical protein